MVRQKTRNGDRGERGRRSENQRSGIRMIFQLAPCQENPDYPPFPGARRDRFQGPPSLKQKSEHLDRKRNTVRPRRVLLELVLLELCSLTIPTEGRSQVGSLHLPAHFPPPPVTEPANTMSLSKYCKAHLRGRLLLASHDP